MQTLWSSLLCYVSCCNVIEWIGATNYKKNHLTMTKFAKYKDKFAINTGSSNRTLNKTGSIQKKHEPNRLTGSHCAWKIIALRDFSQLESTSHGSGTRSAHNYFSLLTVGLCGKTHHVSLKYAVALRRPQCHTIYPVLTVIKIQQWFWTDICHAYAEDVCDISHRARECNDSSNK